MQLNVKSTYIGSKIFDAVDVTKAYDDKVILNGFEYTFARYEKVGIVGNNGVGKSTFIKMLLGEAAPDSGHFDIGETVKFGYYSQDGIQFNEQDKVIDAVRRIAEVVVIDEKTRYTASQFLQLFLFSPETQQNYIYKLSGGEKRRLYLATVLMRTPNFLILDEPTNDLDITTLGILEDYITKFRGCVIIVSHDRFSSTAPSTICLCLKATAWSRISPATIPTTASGRRSRKRRGKAEERRAQSSTPTTHVCQQDDIQGAQGV